MCGENAHAATLCPSFYRAEVVQNPAWYERLVHGFRGAFVRLLQPA
jgi:indolepyruvate ferredoxin oxidoreductase alpha subunit